MPFAALTEGLEHQTILALAPPGERGKVVACGLKRRQDSSSGCQDREPAPVGNQPGHAATFLETSMDGETRTQLESSASMLSTVEHDLYRIKHNLHDSEWRYWAVKEATRCVEDAESKLREVLKRTDQ